MDSTETSSSVPTKALLNTKNTPCMEDMVARLKLSASKILELEGLKTAKGQNQEKKAMEEGDEVTCECGDIVEEYGMVSTTYKKTPHEVLIV